MPLVPSSLKSNPRQPPHTQTARFGYASNLPLLVELNKNQLANRFVIDGLGHSLWSVVIARNKYERMEKVADWGAWVFAGMVFPYFIVGKFARYYSEKLKKGFHLSNFNPRKASPLEAPLEWFDKANYQARIAGFLKEEVKRNPKTLAQLEKLGLKSFNQWTPKLADKVLLGKLLIIWADLLLLATKGQTYAWVKNWAIAKISGKKGFVGVLGYASQDYLNETSEAFEKTKKRRMITSMAVGFGSALIFPLLLLLTLKGSGKRTGMIGWFKNRIKSFNYTDMIFMSKWVMAWHTLFNWNLPTLFASRDRNERRETIIKMLTYDLFFFVGDDIIAGIVGHFLQKRAKGLKTPIVEYITRFKIPRAVPLNKMYEMVKGNTQSKAYRLARTTFLSGLLGTSLLLGIALPLLNFLYTRKKVAEEEIQLRQKKQPLRPMPVYPAFPYPRMTPGMENLLQRRTSYFK